MRLRRFLVPVVVLSVLAMAAPASAGGWWSGVPLHGRDLAVGETFELRTDAHFVTVEAAEAARQRPYFVYLVEDFDRGLLRRAMGLAEPTPWWEPRGEAIKIGRVDLGSFDSNLGPARLLIDVPRMDPGRYALMLCDEGCRQPFADTIPRMVRVSLDPLAASASRRVDRLSAEVAMVRDRQQGELVELRNRLRAAEAEAENAQAEIDAAQAQIKVLAFESSLGPRRDWVTVAVAFVGGALLVVLMLAGTYAVTRRRRALDDDQPPPDEPQDAGLGEWEMTSR